jgi:predicted AAA+ superfamily ATPase
LLFTNGQYTVIVKVMTYSNRTIESTCLKDLEAFPILTLTGPRQSGKSTLLRKLLPDWQYVNLEDINNREFASQDPIGFLKTYSDKVVFDEIQRIPTLLSQIQVVVDSEKKLGRYALTGSHNLLLLEHISQSLAGRTSIRHLLPFSFIEMKNSNISKNSMEENLFLGGYPSVHENISNSTTWLDSYVETYIQRDVRMIKNISDLSTFERFIRVCAARTSQIIDLSSIGNDIGVTHNTIKEWLGVLEAGFVCFKLEPFYKNYSKRIIKRPKIYFYDTGLLCRILRIKTPEELETHSLRGAIFENWCVTEIQKAFFHQGQRPAMSFWRDQKIEVDILIDSLADKILAFECKSGSTIQEGFFKNISELKSIIDDKLIDSYVTYGGDQTQKRSNGEFLSWKDFAVNILDLIV